MMIFRDFTESCLVAEQPSSKSLKIINNSPGQALLSFDAGDPSENAEWVVMHRFAEYGLHSPGVQIPAGNGTKCPSGRWGYDLAAEVREKKEVSGASTSYFLRSLSPRVSPQPVTRTRSP
jgi:hypothetical protein